MEVVGTIASVITIAALAKEVWTLATDLLRNHQKAPQELVHISNQASLILLELECIARTQNEGKPGDLTDSLTKEEAWILQQSLKAAKSSLNIVFQSCQRQCRHAGKAKARLAWSVFEKKNIDEYLGQLHRTETSLGIILQVIDIRASVKGRLDNTLQNEEILRQLAACRDEIQRIRDAVPKTAEQLDYQNFTVSCFNAFRHLQSRSIPKFWSHILDSEILFVQSENEFQNAYQIYARLPLLWFLGQKALVLSTSVRRTKTYWPNFQLLNGGINVCNLVPVDSEIVQACRRGDVLAVRNLFRAHKASPTDMSTDDKSLLWHATESGSTELTQFLLSAGAPVRPNTLHVASYYRRPQIARLLLNSGADVEAVGCCGYTTPSFLFRNTSQKKEAQIEFLDILGSNSFSSFNGKDDKGWSTLHRAAAFGTAADVKRLVQMKASLHCTTYNLHWTPIFFAICHGNLETTEELLTLYDAASLVSMADLRGWNLLHVAVGAGNFRAVPYLLEKGVDLERRSRATSHCVPRGLANMSITPSEVAASFGAEAYQHWSEAVGAAGRELGSRFEDITWIAEDAESGFSGCECCKQWKCSS